MSGHDDYRIRVSVRIPQRIVRAADHLGIDLGLYRGQVLALLLDEALWARGISVAPTAAAEGDGE